MGVVLTTPILSLRKGIYVYHLHWYIVRKFQMTRSNLYEKGECVRRRNILVKDKRKLVATDCLTRGPWFGKFMRGNKLSMGIVRNQDFSFNMSVRALLGKRNMIASKDFI